MFLPRINRRRGSQPACVGRPFDRVELEILNPDDPRCSFAQVLGRQRAVFDQAAYARGADVERSCRFVEGCLTAFGAFTLAIGRDLAVIPQLADARSRPAIAAPGCLSCPVEYRGYGLIRHL